MTFAVIGVWTWYGGQAVRRAQRRDAHEILNRPPPLVHVKTPISAKDPQDIMMPLSFPRAPLLVFSARAWVVPAKQGFMRKDIRRFSLK